ncbi:PIN domain-containing protein [Sulfuriferula sp.]|uniref:PIN domain-containing protein n=1 Tax=Sulfuriferula sp. TaxID=2025307 RepID=UPI003522C576
MHPRLQNTRQRPTVSAGWIFTSKIEGTGKNALDFHIAFQLGRTIETAPQTECFVLSKDKGFDPLHT